MKKKQKPIKIKKRPLRKGHAAHRSGAGEHKDKRTKRKRTREKKNKEFIGPEKWGRTNGTIFTGEHDHYDSETGETTSDEAYWKERLG